MMPLLDIFISAFIALFVIVDPVGTAAAYAVLARGKTTSESIRTSVKAGVIATTILIVFGLIGAWLLSSLGITLAAFRIAGGVLLFGTAYRMIAGYDDPNHEDHGKNAYGKGSDIAVFPLAIPFMAGPGCMTAALLHMTAEPGVWEAKFVVTVAIIIVQLICVLAMIFSHRLMTLMGPTGGSLIARIMGILLAALSVQFVADGIRQLFFA